MAPSPSPPSGPFFLPTSQDVPRLAVLTHELDGKALQCVEVADCEQVYFSRALIELFDNREAARASFRHVIEHNPGSPLASSSTLWLRLMEQEERAVASNDTEFSALTELMAQFVREWIERQLSERQALERPVTTTAIQEQPVEPPRVVRGLQKQVRERDRQIAILRGQLEALKSIDQDHAEKQRKVKPPPSLRIVEEDAP